MNAIRDPRTLCRALSPEIFGPEKSPSIMGTQMAIGSCALMLLPVVCGFIGENVGMWVFPVIMLIFFVPLIFATIRLRRETVAEGALFK